MIRYAAALAVALLPSLAFADSIDPSRDVNLGLIGNMCLLVVVQSNDPAITAAESDITKEIADRALLYSVPVKENCISEYNTLPTLVIYLHAVGIAIVFEAHVVMPNRVSGFAEPDVWSATGVGTKPTGITSQDAKTDAGVIFDNFALAWKKQHQP